jgi:hypothetical protein
MWLAYRHGLDPRGIHELGRPAVERCRFGRLLHFRQSHGLVPPLDDWVEDGRGRRLGHYVDGSRGLRAIGRGDRAGKRRLEHRMRFDHDDRFRLRHRLGTGEVDSARCRDARRDVRLGRLFDLAGVRD